MFDTKELFYKNIDEFIIENRNNQIKELEDNPNVQFYRKFKNNLVLVISKDSEFYFRISDIASIFKILDEESFIEKYSARYILIKSVPYPIMVPFFSSIIMKKILQDNKVEQIINDWFSTIISMDIINISPVSPNNNDSKKKARCCACPSVIN